MSLDRGYLVFDPSSKEWSTKAVFSGLIKELKAGGATPVRKNNFIQLLKGDQDGPEFVPVMYSSEMLESYILERVNAGEGSGAIYYFEDGQSVEGFDLLISPEKKIIIYPFDNAPLLPNSKCVDFSIYCSLLAKPIFHLVGEYSLTTSQFIDR